MGLKLYGKPVTDYTKESLLKFVNKFQGEEPDKTLPLLQAWADTHGGEVMQLSIPDKPTPTYDIYYNATDGTEVMFPQLSNKFVLTMPDGVDLFFETDGAMWAFINKQPKKDLKHLKKVGPMHFEFNKAAWQPEQPEKPVKPGTVIVNPNNALIIWASTLEEKKTEDGKYEYFQSFAVIVRPHVTEKLVRIWVTDANCEVQRLIYEAGQASYKEPGLTLTYYDGTQNKPDPLLANHFGKGAPSYKGSSYVMIKDFNLTKHDGNKIPHLKFEVKVKSPDKTLDQAEEEWAATLIKPEVQLAAKVEQPPDGWIKKPAQSFPNPSADGGTVIHKESAGKYYTKPYEPVEGIPPISIEVDSEGNVTGVGADEDSIVKFKKPANIKLNPKTLFANVGNEPGAQEVFQVPSMLSPEKSKKFIEKMKNVPPMSQKKLLDHVTWKDFHIGVEKVIHSLHYNVSIIYHDASGANLTKTMKIPYDILGKEGHHLVKSLADPMQVKAIFYAVTSKGKNPLDLNQWHEVLLQTLGLLPQ
jgi:hypothetical protein